MAILEDYPSSPLALAVDGWPIANPGLANVTRTAGSERLHIGVINTI